MFTQYTGTVSSGAIPTLPSEQRYSTISYRNADGTVGETAYPINYDELYNLKGRLLTLIDATFTDQEQRKAFKDVVWQTVQRWMADIETRYSGEGCGHLKVATGQDVDQSAA